VGKSIDLREYKEEEKCLVVPTTHTVVDNGAMVVKALDAIVADFAM
jgi:hypothetical protein